MKRKKRKQKKLEIGKEGRRKGSKMRKGRKKQNKERVDRLINRYRQIDTEITRERPCTHNPTSLHLLRVQISPGNNKASSEMWLASISWGSHFHGGETSMGCHFHGGPIFASVSHSPVASPTGVGIASGGEEGDLGEVGEVQRGRCRKIRGRIENDAWFWQKRERNR